MSDKVEKKIPKFTLKGVQHRIRKLPLTATVMVAEEVVENFPVSWVRVRGSQDPVYLKRVAPAMVEYQEETELAVEEFGGEGQEEERKAAFRKALDKLMIKSVTYAIESWDDDFFGEPFSQEEAYKLFSLEDNNHIYNQISEYMGRREDFLPVVGVQP